MKYIKLYEEIANKNLEPVYMKVPEETVVDFYEYLLKIYHFDFSELPQEFFNDDITKHYSTYLYSGLDRFSNHLEYDVEYSLYVPFIKHLAEIIYRDYPHLGKSYIAAFEKDLSKETIEQFKHLKNELF